MDLPQGWLSTEPAWLPGCCVLSRPGGGEITIDWNKRKYALGVILPRGYKGTTYSGRGWRERIVADAIKALDDCMDGTPNLTVINGGNYGEQTP